MKKSNVYTRTGDTGTTSLVGGTRAAKDDVRLEAYGTVDEANSWLGLLNASLAIPAEAHATLQSAMNRLFDIGSALATEPESSWQPDAFPDRAIAVLEADIDALDYGPPRRRTGQHSAHRRAPRRAPHHSPVAHRHGRPRHHPLHQPSERLPLHTQPRHQHLQPARRNILGEILNNNRKLLSLRTF